MLANPNVSVHYIIMWLFNITYNARAFDPRVNYQINIYIKCEGFLRRGF